MTQDIPIQEQRYTCAEWGARLAPGKAPGPIVPAPIEVTLSERGLRYGKFATHAQITQGIKYAMTQSRNWGVLSNDKQEALEMIAHKIGRVLNGDPSYADSWVDIAGYATLVVKELEGHGV